MTTVNPVAVCRPEGHDFTVDGLQKAKEVIVLPDAGKLGRDEQTAWAPLPPRWMLVTDSGASEQQRRSLADAGARIIIAGGR